MTDKEKLEKVRAEIEGRKKEVEDNIFELGNFESERMGLFDNKEIYNDLLSFIDSMQEECNITGIKSKEATGKLKECIDNVSEEGLEEARKQLEEDSKECMYSTANYTNADRLTLCKDCEKLCKYNQKTAAESLGISQEVYDEIVDKCLYGSEVELVDDGDLPKEEPASEDLEEVVEEIVDPTVLNAYGVKEIANRLRMTMIESVSEDFEAEWKEYFKYRGDIATGNIKDLAKHFANWQKQQMMIKAVKVNISNTSIVSLPMNCSLKVGDKVLIIKED